MERRSKYWSLHSDVHEGAHWHSDAYSEASMRILVIEDERRLAGNIARSLRESAGYAVDCSYDGEEGLYMAESNPYDLVILDLMLPRLEGMQVLARLRKAG